MVNPYTATHLSNNGLINEGCTVALKLFQLKHTAFFFVMTKIARQLRSPLGTFLVCALSDARKRQSDYYHLSSTTLGNSTQMFLEGRVSVITAFPYSHIRYETGTDR